MQRVVITGMGCLTPIGNTVGELWQSIQAGRSGIAPFVPLSGELDPRIKFRNAGQVRGFDPSALTNTQALSNTQINTTERNSQFAIFAARQAVEQSGLLAHHAPDKIAILLGNSTGGRHSDEPEVVRVEKDDGRVHPLAIARCMASSGVSQVALDHGITGPALTVSTACASGGHAIGLAFQMVRSGLVTAALAGAHEAPLTRTFLRGWDSMRVVSPTACRPFSADRDGMTLAEGAAVLAFETLASAKARNATIFAEILGFGMSSDAHHITQPKPEGSAQAMLACLKDAAETLHGTDRPGSLQSLLGDVNYINAHGTATHANDEAEAAALHLVFGARTPQIPVSSTKGFYGHSLGASSAIEAVITSLALYHRSLPHTANTLVADPALNLDVILDAPRAAVAEAPITALSNSLAFGGLNAILCFRSYA